MRALIVSRTYVNPTCAPKLRELAAHDDVELSVVVPTWWDHALRRFDAQPSAMGVRWHIVDVARDNGSNERFRFRTLPLAKALARGKPDLIHVEEEPWSRAAYQTYTLARKFARSAKLGFFTWQNFVNEFIGSHARYERHTLGHADFAIAGNQDAVRVLQEKGFDRPVTLSPQLGVDLSDYPWPPVQPPEPVIGFVGRVAAPKGLHSLVEAVSRLDSPVELLFIGGGDAEDELAELARARGVALTITGAVPPESVVEHLRRLSVMVLPSLSTPRWVEQFGRVLIEAMACGVPVVGSSSGAIPEVIGDAGLVFPEGDAEALAAHLSRLLGDSGLRSSLSSKGRERVAGHYTHAHVAEKTLNAWRDALR